MGRAERFRTNHQIIVQGMHALGFIEFVPRVDQGSIISLFQYPPDPRFNFDTFYQALHTKGVVIYPGKVRRADCFRIGHIGRITPADSYALLDAIRTTLDEMDVPLKQQPPGKE